MDGSVGAVLCNENGGNACGKGVGRSSEETAEPGQVLMSSDGAVTGAVCVPGTAGLQGCSSLGSCEWEPVGTWGLGACSAPQSCRLGVAPPREGWESWQEPSRACSLPRWMGGPVSLQSSAAGGDALTLARLLIASVVKAEFSCPCCITQ